MKCDNKSKLSHKSSQSNQDLLLYYHYFQNKRNGFFIEIGAYDGVKLSNTLLFEKSLNWHGILIEGGEINCKDLKRNAKIRSNSVVICSPICKSDYISYYEKDVFGTINRNYNKSNKLRKCNTLKKITNYYNIKHIDLFSLDVEGSELEVLETFDFNVNVSHWMIEWNHLNHYTRNNITSILNKNGYYMDRIRISTIDVIFSKKL